MIALRAFLLSGGLVAGGYGALLLSDNPVPILIRIAVWAAAGVLLHDFVFAPVCAALGWAGGRLLPASVRAPVGIAALALVTIGLLAIPVYDKPGLHPDNPTVLNRSYHQGVLWTVGVVMLGLAGYLFWARLPIRQNHVVENQRADDVESQPPAV